MRKRTGAVAREGTRATLPGRGSETPLLDRLDGRSIEPGHGRDHARTLHSPVRADEDLHHDDTLDLVDEGVMRVDRPRDRDRARRLVVVANGGVAGAADTAVRITARQATHLSAVDTALQALERALQAARLEAKALIRRGAFGRERSLLDPRVGCIEGRVRVDPLCSSAATLDS